MLYCYHCHRKINIGLYFIIFCMLINYFYGLSLHYLMDKNLAILYRGKTCASDGWQLFHWLQENCFKTRGNSTVHWDSIHKKGLTNCRHAWKSIQSKNIQKTNNSWFLFVYKGQYCSAFKQSLRKEDDIAIVTCGMNVIFKEESNIVQDIRLSYGGMAPTTVLATTTCNRLLGR